MNELEVLSYKRQIGDVTRDIRAKTCEFLRTAIEIGRLLFEAKAMVEPGGWSKYIEEELPFSHSWANNYMKLYKEYGSDQTSLFGGESQAFMNLSPTQALELLALPAEDREEFVETHDVEEMSTRQLRQAVQEQLEQERQAHEGTKKALEDAEEKARAANQDLLNLQQELAAMKSHDSAWEETVKKQQKMLDDLRAKERDSKLELSQARAREKEAQEALEKERENPDIPEAVMEKLRKEAEAEAARAASAQAEERAKAAEATAREAQEKLALAEKQLKMASPDVAEYKTLLEKLNADYTSLDSQRRKITAHDRETGQKLEKLQEKVVTMWARALGMEVK